MGPFLLPSKMSFTYTTGESRRTKSPLNEVIELSSIVLLHKFNSPQWLKHIQKSVAQLASLTPLDLSSLNPGEAFLWATKATDTPLTNRPVKISTRPRVTKHGGETVKTI
jgi:hypothetical protein